jgi:hypothetical protein
MRKCLWATTHSLLIYLDADDNKYDNDENSSNILSHANINV